MMTLLVCTALLAQEEARSPWEGFGPGSHVRIRITVAKEDKHESSLITTAVVRVEGDSVTLKTQVQGTEPRSRVENVARDPAAKRIALEDVDIDGKTFACSVYERTTEEKGVRVTVKEWLSRDVPGRAAKREEKAVSDKGEVTISGRLTRLNQKIRIDGKEITYAVYESRRQASDGSSGVATRWISEQVPGFVVREETRKERDDGRGRQAVTELVSFESK